MNSDFLMRQLAVFIYTLARNGPVVFLGTLGIAVFGLGPIGRALAARIRGVAPSLPADDPSLAALKAGMTDLQERLDFSERVLTELRQRLIGGGGPVPPAPPGRAVTPV